MSRAGAIVALARRELRGAFSKRRLVVLLVLWILVLLAVHSAFWPESVRTHAEMAEYARALLVNQCLALVLGLCVALPSIAAVSVSAEREQETLDQLLLTLLTPRAIIAGKTLGAGAVAIALLIATMPMFAVLQFSVGLGNTQILMLAIYTLLFARATIHTGVACSAVFRRALTSLVCAYLLPALISICPLFYVWTQLGPYRLSSLFSLTRGTGAQLPWDVVAFRAICPPCVLADVVETPVSATWFALVCLPPLVMSAVALRVARFALTRTAEPRSLRQTRLINDARMLEARRKTFPYYLIDPLKPLPPISDESNPMLVREFRWGLFHRATWMVRSTYAAFLVSFLAYAMGALTFVAAGPVIVSMLVVCVLMLAVPATLGNAFTKERELGNFDMLRMTLLEPREILWGKAIGGIATLAPALAVMVAGGILANAFNFELYPTVFCGFVTIAVSFLVIVAQSLLCSLVARRTSKAVMSGAALGALFLFGVVPLVILVQITGVLLSDIVGDGKYRSESLPDTAWMLSSPVYGYVGVFYSESVRLPGSAELPRHSGLWLLSSCFAVALAIATFVAAEYVVLRRRMRDV